MTVDPRECGDHLWRALVGDFEHIAVIEDPFYLAEPLVWTRDFYLSTMPMANEPPPCIVTFEGTRLGGDAPHFLWGKRGPELDLLTQKYGVPREAVLGYPETLYPEYREKLKQK